MKENYIYPAKITNEGDCFQIEFIDFVNLFTYGETIDKVIKAAQEILAVTILDYLDRGIELPEPSYNSNECTFIHIWLPYFKSSLKEVYVRKSVTLPQWLDILAKQKNINFSAALVRGIKQELGIID